MLHLTARPDGPATAYVIESHMSAGHGPVLNVLVRSGSLRPGDHFVCGLQHARVRSLINAHGELLTVWVQVKQCKFKAHVN